MKKIIGIILLVAVISAAAIYAYKVLNVPKVGPIESIVPEDTIYYLYSYNPGKKIKDFEASDFWQQFMLSPVYKKFIGDKMESMKAKMPFVMDFIESDVAVAVFSTGDTELGAKGSDDDIGTFLLYLRVLPNKFSKIKAEIAERYAKISLKSQAKHTNHKGIKISTYAISNSKVEISLAFLSDVLVIGNDLIALQKSVDLYLNKSKSSLALNADFKMASSKIKKDALLWGYQNNQNYYQDVLRKYTSMSMKYSKKGDSQSAEMFVKMKPFINMMNVFKGYAFYIDYLPAREGILFKAYHAFDRSKDKDGILAVFAPEMTIDNKTLDLLSKAIVAYYGGVQDFSATWNFFKSFYTSMDEIMKAQEAAQSRRSKRRSSAQDMSPSQALESFQSFSGINLKQDLLPLLGNNFGIVFAGLKEEKIMPSANANAAPGMVPRSFPIIFPDIYVFCELKDTAKMSQVMDTMVKNLVANANKSIKEQEEKRRQSYIKFKEEMDKNNPASQGKDASAVDLPADPFEGQDPITLKTDSYGDVNIYSLELMKFPIASFKPSYCILDKYILVSLSTDSTAKTIDNYKNRRSTFNSNFDFQQLMQSNFPDSYSGLMYFDINKLIESLTNTEFFKLTEQQLDKARGKDFTSEDLDSAVDTLKNISSAAFTNTLTDSDTMESTLCIKVKGL